MDSKIFLQKFNSKRSVNTSEGLNVSLKGKRKLLPTNDLSETISQYDVYTEERNNSNIIRLTCQVNTVCSNVLFNKVTEIVKDEGSSAVSFINYGILSGKSSNTKIAEDVKYKTKSLDFWKRNNIQESIRDTQLTNYNYIYHCGADIFNNHLVRSNTFKSICSFPTSDINNHEEFNTIRDLMRNSEGEQVYDKIYYPINSNLKSTSSTALHLYKYDDLYTYKDCINNRLVKTFEGWLGFYNKPKIKTYKNYGSKKENVIEESLGIERPIMYLNGGDFVDMYPDRTLYSFVPKYNKYRNRVEKNWNYCLTYPSSSYTPSLIDGSLEFTDIIEPSNGALKALYYNENTIADNGVRQLVIYSIAKHGLSVDDHVNIYNTVNGESVLVLENARVTNIADDFIFTVVSTTLISKYWVLLENEDYKTDELTLIIDNQEKIYKYVNDGHYFIKKGDFDNRYYVIDGTNYANFDDNAQNISYKKVVGGIECEYYVRIFSKIPNFKNASADTSNAYEIYKDDGRLIDEYQTKKYDFESHVSRLAFAKNSYSDNIGEIVFTDNIDISNLRDNRGRPLTSIYLTIVKNNKGYKEWYGFNDYNNKWSDGALITADTVEFSHCFGMITCGIETCQESRYENGINSINKINNIGDSVQGFNVEKINGDRDGSYRQNIIPSNEVWFDLDKHYYGDLCCYDGYNAVEISLQPILHRFNTAQRESSVSKSSTYFNYFKYDEITKDDYDINSRKFLSEYERKHTNSFKEGYYYNPHHEIKFRTFGGIKTTMPDFLTLRKIEFFNNDVKFTTLENHYLSMGDKTILYDKINDEYYYCKANTSLSDGFKVFTSTIYTINNELIEPFYIFYRDGKKRPTNEFKMFKFDNLEVPNYANILKDGTCRIIWRDVINNGFDANDDTVEKYPFTNGAFYINKGVNLYVKRQDPYGVWGLYAVADDIEGASVNIEEEDNYVKESEIEC